MIEKARSINIAATIILALGIVYILGPLYLAVTTASHSYTEMLQNGISWLPGTICPTTSAASGWKRASRSRWPTA